MEYKLGLYRVTTYNHRQLITGNHHMEHENLSVDLKYDNWLLASRCIKHLNLSTNDRESANLESAVNS